MNFFKKLSNRKGSPGFSLVELMIVVAIIGILAALAVPRFQMFQAKSKQSEAKSNLSHIYTLQQSYYADFDAYTTSLTDMGFTTQGHVRYGYSIASATGAAFIAWANATSTTVITADCTFADSWNMNENKALVAVKDCALNTQTAKTQ
jgi:type IV pilus assembly protein PilA